MPRKINDMTKTLALIAALVLQAGAAAQPVYDLLLKGGHVIDPRNEIDEPLDLGIANGKVAHLAGNIPSREAKKVVDVSGLYVVPGLVDIHVHVYLSGYADGWGVNPDSFTFRSGVTTVVDAGASGWRNFADLKDRVIDRSKTRVLAMLNNVGHGMGDKTEQNRDDMDPRATARVALQYPDLIVGIKTAHFEGPEWVAVDRAVEAGRLTGLPVMVDFGRLQPERPYQELVLKHLRPGDISTHMYGFGVPILDDEGKVLPYLFEARDRGVKFDVGHGGGSFHWGQAVPAIRQGWMPDSISTDLHRFSMNWGMKDMLNVMSKILNQGVSLRDVIQMSTANPAAQIKRDDLGHLGVGAGADVAVIRVEHGRFGFLDVHNKRVSGTKRLVCELTLRDGARAWDLNGLAGEDWPSP